MSKIQLSNSYKVNYTEKGIKEIIDKTSTQESLTHATKEKEWWKEDFLLVKQDWIRGHLNRLDRFKSMGPEGMNTGALVRLHVEF